MLLFMPTITASIGLTVDMWQKCQKYGINRSAIARSAIGKEIERIEKETGAIAAKQTTPATATCEGRASKC